MARKSNDCHFENYLRRKGVFIKREDDGSLSFLDDRIEWNFKGNIPNTIKPQTVIPISLGIPSLLVNLIAQHGPLIASKGQARELIYEGNVNVNERQITDEDFIVHKNCYVTILYEGSLDRAVNFAIDINMIAPEETEKC